eukprot:7516012-Pyramimonas_sp.AAC.1
MSCWPTPRQRLSPAARAPWRAGHCRGAVSGKTDTGHPCAPNPSEFYVCPIRELFGSLQRCRALKRADVYAEIADAEPRALRTLEGGAELGEALENFSSGSDRRASAEDNRDNRIKNLPCA